MAHFWTNGFSDLYLADARDIPLPDDSVHCVVTSPPYWGLRNYGLGEWVGGDAECEHCGQRVQSGGTNSPKQNSHPGSQDSGIGTCTKCGAVNTPAGIGLESTLAEHLDSIVATFREVRRVLRDDGTLWLNYGDAYANSNPGWDANGRGLDGKERQGSKAMCGRRTKHTALKPKNLMGLPWRVAFALQDDGWILRSAIVWHKPNPMPESVRDRPTNAYEMVFLFSQQPRYFYDAEAIRDYSGNGWHSNNFAARSPERHAGENREVPKEAQPSGANARNVWTIPTQGRPDAHFATFPDELPRRCILAGTSERGACSECGAQWERDDDVEGVWNPTCDCDAPTIPATVLDPFVGSGTTVAVAQSLGRRGIGLDLNAEYLDIAKRRIGAVSLPMAGLA